MTQGRVLLASETGDDDLWDVIDELREEMLALAEEMQELRTSLVEANERLDFSERVLAQIKEPPAMPRG